MKKLFFLFVSVFFSFWAIAQTPNGRFLYNEKVYLVTDKEVYAPCDSIRIKGFVVDSWEHRIQDVSRYLYVELITNNDEVIERRKIRRDSLGFHTVIALDSTKINGTYYLRGYTQPMKYLPPEYIFIKHISVDNHPRPEQRATFDGEILSADSTYTVSFFPEGGAFVPDTPQRVVFRCADKYGFPVISEGVVLNHSGDTLSQVGTQYGGYGEFILAARREEKYRYIDTKGTVFPIDIRFGEAAVVVAPHKHRLRFEVKGTSTGTLTIHTHGRIIQECPISAQNRSGTIDVRDFNGGILCLTFSNKGEVCSERLYYIGSENQVFDLPKTEYSTGEEVTIRHSNETTGDFAITITKSNETANPATRNDIRTSILVQSELPEPLINGDRLTQQEVNLGTINRLLITQRWNRYVQDTEHLDPAFGKEEKEFIYGRIRGTRPKNVSIFSTALDEMYFIEPNANGEFYKEIPDFVGLSSFYIQPMNKENKGIFSTVDIRDDLFPEIDNRIKPLAKAKLASAWLPVKSTPHPATSPQMIEENDTDKNIWTLSVNPVEVTGTKKVREILARSKEYYGATMLVEEDVQKYSNFNIADAVNRLLGVTVINAFQHEKPYLVVSSRGMSTFNPMKMPNGQEVFGCPMAVYVDGVEMDHNIALRMPPAEIKSISRLTIAEASLKGGSRGFCGAIEIRTKKYGDEKPANSVVSKGVSIDKQGYYPNLAPTFTDQFISTTGLPSEIKVNAPKQTGNYILRIEGIDNKGSIVEHAFEISVK